MAQQNNDDLINELDEVLDEDDEVASYIGKTFLYKCTDCGIEKYVKGDELDDVICEECGGEMHIAEEGVFDKQQTANEGAEGKTDLELTQDQTEEELDLHITDEDTGNISDLSETDEVLESIDVDVDVDLELVDEDEVEIISEDDEIDLEDEDDELSSYDDFVLDFDEDEESY